VGVGGNVFVAGNIDICGNTMSISSNTGAFIVAGGVGVAGNVFVGNKSIVNANIYQGTGYSIYSTYNTNAVGTASNVSDHLYIHTDSNYTYLDSGGGNPFLVRGSNNSSYTTGTGDVGTQPYGNIISAVYSTSGNGYIGINKVITTTPTYMLDVSGTIIASGQITGLSFNATSDYRIKQNVAPLDSTFSVDKLHPVHYDNLLSNNHDIGFLAHEVQDLYPYLVSGIKDGSENQSINYNGFVGILVHEIQILKQEIATLKTRLDKMG